MIPVKKIKTQDEWDRLKDSNNEEIILFKFSPMCGTSFSVERSFDNWVSALQGKQNLNCVKINVITAKELSRQITSELGIKHESPQVIWFNKDKSVKWHASHYDITVEKLSRNLS